VCTCRVVPAVVVDRREERDCDTGRFELAYKQVCVCPGLFEFDYCNTCLDATAHNYAVLVTSFPVPHPAFCHLFVIDLSFSQPKLEMPAYVGIQLCVEGSSIPKPGLHKKAHKVAAPVIRLGYWSA